MWISLIICVSLNSGISYVTWIMGVVVLLLVYAAFSNRFQSIKYVQVSVVMII